MSKAPTKIGQLTSNDEDVLGVFDRLKANINEIKTANSSRNSAERTMDTNDSTSVRGRHSRQNSVNTDTLSSRHSKSHRVTVAPDLAADGDVREQNTVRVNGKHSTTLPTESESGKHRHGNRSRVESYSSRAEDTSRTSIRSQADHAKRSSHQTPSERSLYTGQNLNRTLNREHSRTSTGRDSRASERSYRSRRPNGFDQSTEKFLDQYHREWMMHWQFQQQQQLQQQQAAQQSISQYGYGNAVHYPAPPTLLSPSTTVTSLPPAVLKKETAVAKETVVSSSVPAATVPLPTFVAPVPTARPPLTVPLLKPASAVIQKAPSRPQRAEFKGCLLTATSSSEILRSGRTTTLLVKSTPHHVDSKYEIEMDTFPGMMLWDGPELRDRVVDFGRHMSSVANETADYGTVEIESVFWDLVVHLVSRAENSRPYEVSEILTRLVQDTGRNSVASIRSTAGGFRYPDQAMHDIRKRLLVGDVESAVKCAEDSHCWDLALCLQAVSSNFECKNQQANDLAVKCLDQRLQRGDPVHTVCSLACGRLPNVEACFRDWVSNLAIVIACAGFVQQEELKLRFISNLSELLHSADMPVARDICLIFCNPLQRFEGDVRLLPIGALADFSGGRNFFLENFSLENFYMTEAFVFLAQILQGTNLHTKVDLIKMELRYIQMLLDRGMRRQAAEYCRNIVMVVKEYGVDLPVEIYSQLFDLTTLCVASGQAEFHDEWCQWLWSVFVKNGKRGTADSKRSRRSESQDSTGFTVSTNRTFYPEDLPIARPYRDDDSESVHSGIYPAVKPSISDISAAREIAFSTYSGGSRRGSLAAEDLAPYSGGRRPSEPQPAVISVTVPEVFTAPIPPPPSVSSTSLHAKLTPQNSLSDKADISHDQREEPLPPPPPVQMYQPAAAPARPSVLMPFPNSSSVLTPFPGPSQSAAAFLTPTPTEAYSPVTPGDSSLNQGNAHYFSQNEPSTSKFHDPTAFDDEPPSKSKKAEQNERKEKLAEDVRKNPGLLGKIAGFFKRSGQIHLPADTKPKLIYDNEKKRWVDTSKPEGEREETVAPPPKMQFPQPVGPSISGGPSSSGPPPPSGNAFRLAAAPASGGYNPYSHLLKTAPPPRTFDMSNHFIPAPTIPEE